MINNQAETAMTAEQWHNHGDFEYWSDEEVEAYAAHVREAAPIEYLVNDAVAWNREAVKWQQRAETAKRKLAELEKAFTQLLDHDGGEGSKDYDASKILVARAALASLRAESKEPVD